LFRAEFELDEAEAAEALKKAKERTEEAEAEWPA
jgi:hypothetical protein